MADGLGCCAEHEMMEAAARARKKQIAKATKTQIMFGHEQREKIEESIRFGVDGPGEVNVGKATNDFPPQVPTTEEMEDASSSDFEDSEDDAIMAQMRAQRLKEMRANAEIISKKVPTKVFSHLGTHRRLRDINSLADLISKSRDDASRLIVHLGSDPTDPENDADDPDNACRWTEDALKRCASDFSSAQIITIPRCSRLELPSWLPKRCKLPVLLVFEGGELTKICSDLALAKDPRSVRSLVSNWLFEIRGYFMEKSRAASAKPETEEIG